MTAGAIDELLRMTDERRLVRAVVIEAQGSTPRDVGAAMHIGTEDIAGSIGGGALEHDVIARARILIATAAEQSWDRCVAGYHLGPELNQCCGGATSILLEVFGPAERAALRVLVGAPTAAWLARPLAAGAAPEIMDAAEGAAFTFARGGERWFSEPIRARTTPLVLYGAGHVGRALVKLLADLPFDVSWVDVEAQRFPAEYPATVRTLVGDPSSLMADFPDNAVHLVMTHAHDLDQAIVAAILRRGRFGYLGLIGSATKRARFAQRLRRDGFAAEQVERIVCPIGLPGLSGKEPSVIALSVAADLLSRLSAKPGLHNGAA